MKVLLSCTVVVVALAGTVFVCAETRSSEDYSITMECVGLGGMRMTNDAMMVLDSGIGRLGRISSAVGDAYVCKSGYSGQLYDMQDLSLSVPDTHIAETETRLLVALAENDDSTVTRLYRPDWSIDDGPVSSINSTGLLFAGAVYEDTPAQVGAEWDGLSATIGLMITETDPDNYGAYGYDGLEDDWQIQHFGIDNLKAKPGADPDGDLQNNRFEWFVHTAPTNADSLFEVWIVGVPGASTQACVVCRPAFIDRQYVLQACSDLGEALFVDCPDTLTNTNGQERRITDLNIDDASRFYRIQVTEAP